MASALSNVVTNSEEVHRNLQRIARAKEVGQRFPYFRFNVERDVGDIGLEDRKKTEEISVLTRAYLKEQDVEEKTACVNCLISPPDFTRE